MVFSSYASLRRKKNHKNTPAFQKLQWCNPLRALDLFTLLLVIECKERKAFKHTSNLCEPISTWYLKELLLILAFFKTFLFHKSLLSLRFLPITLSSLSSFTTFNKTINTVTVTLRKCTTVQNCCF